MQYKLLSLVFEKALAEGAPNTKNGLATYVHDAMEAMGLKPPTAKTISTYRQKMDANENYAISREILNEFSKYMGFEDYRAFLQKNKQKVSHKKRNQFVIAVLLAILAFFIYDFSRKKCMRWNGKQYVQVHCEEENAKPIKQALLVNFRKLQADCKKDFFFKKDGSPKVWYFKRGDNDLELFSSSGAHPVKGNDLRKINEAMIRKHICEEF